MSDQDIVSRLSAEAELDNLKVENANLERLLESTRKSMDIQIEAGIKSSYKIAELMNLIRMVQSISNPNGPDRSSAQWAIDSVYKIVNDYLSKK